MPHDFSLFPRPIGIMMEVLMFDFLWLRRKGNRGGMRKTKDYHSS